MTEPTTPQLTEAEVQEIEERDWFLSAESLEKQVALTITERDALIRDWRALRAERDAAMAVLAPSMPESGLEDACRQLKQACMSEADNCEALEQINMRLSTGLVNIYHVITGEACPHGVALGMATSAVSSLKSENAALREQLAEVQQIAETRSDVIAAKAARIDQLQSQLTGHSTSTLLRRLKDFLFERCDHSERDRNYDWCPSCVMAFVDVIAQPSNVELQSQLAQVTSERDEARLQVKELSGYIQGEV